MILYQTNNFEIFKYISGPKKISKSFPMTSATSNSGKTPEEITSTSNTTRHQKFRGLLKRKPSKIFRDNLFRFFDYLYTIAPSHLIIILIMKYLHFIQIGILSFFPFSSTLWPDNSLLGKISKVLSIGATIIPARASISAHLFFEMIIYLLYFSFVIFFFICFRLFQVYTKISTFSIKIITIIMNAFLPFLISITSSNLGLDLFLIINHNKQDINTNSSNYYYIHTNYSFPLVIFNFILGLIELISMILFQTIFVTPSLTFRPQAIHILSPHASIIYFLFIFYYSFSTTFCIIYEGNKGYFRLVFGFLNVFPLGFLLYNLYAHTEIWVTNSLHQTLLSLSHMIVITLIVLLTLLQLNQSMNEICIFLFILVFCVSHYIIPYITSYNHKRNLLILDKIDENEEILTKISTNKYLQLLRTGFDTGHELCHSWKLFKMADKKMTKNKTFINIYAHYAAIYPDESAILHYVCKLIKKVKHNNIDMKYLSFQIHNLLQQRERGLSKTIKKTCTKISDKTEKCRDQLRLVWQSVINGSTSELDDLTSQLKKNEDEISREYTQLCFVYPNNPYIASAYSAFLSDILCNDRESEEYAKIYRLLRSGAKTRVERSYYFATMMIKTLPDVHQHSILNNDNQKQLNNNNNRSLAIGNVLAANKQEDVNEEKTQQRYIEMMIDSVRLPSLRYGPFILFLIVSLAFPVLSIFLLTSMISNLNNNMFCSYSMELFSFLRTHLCQLSMTSYYYALSKNRFITPLSLIGNSDIQQSDEEVFLSSVNEAVFSLNLINTYYPKLHGSSYLFGDPLRYLNSPLINYDLFSTINNKTETMWSFQHISSFIGLVAVELSNKKSYQMLRFPELRTLVFNSITILFQTKNMADIYLHSFRFMNDDTYYRLLYLVIAIGGGFLIFGIIVIIVIFVKMNNEKKLLYDSFKTLPKSTISSIVDKIDAQSGKHADQDTTIQPMSLQEQNAMRILNLTSDRRTHINEELLMIVLLLLIAVIVIIFMMIFSIEIHKKICKQFPQISTTIFDLTRIHSTFFTLLLTEMRIAAMNNDQLKVAFPENVSQLIEQCGEIINAQFNNFIYMQFGRHSDESEKFSLIGGDLISFLTNSPEIESIVPQNTSHILTHISLENKMYFIFDLLNQIYTDLLFQQKIEGENMTFSIRLDDQKKKVEIDDFRFQLILKYLLNDENQTFLYKGLSLIHNKIDQLYHETMNERLLWPIIVCDVVVFICGIVVVLKFIRITERAQWTLKLLLFCPANIVFQSQTISKLLSNDFSNSETDENEESSQFYENIIAHYPDPVIFVDTEMKINSVNDAFYMIFNKDISEVFHKKLNEVFNNSNFLNTIENIMNENEPPYYHGNVDLEINKEMFTFDVSLVAVNINGEIQKQTAPMDSISMFTITMINITNSVKLNDTYIKEKESVKKLLSASIPKNFLNQPAKITKIENKTDSVQGSSSVSASLSDPLLDMFNVCFKVNNASIIAIKIVGISNQQNLNTIEFVQRLNSIYNEFDKILSTSNYGDMTRISSFSGTFVAAAGLLNDSVSPQTHAKQAMSFASDIISCFDKLKTSFDIRVGISTGGPMVAGILDLSQPVFELFGSPISIAMHLAETGNSMQIHIPQLVYDLVYSEKYVFKEAEDVTYKQQTMKTYLVSCCSQPAYS